MNMIQFWFAYSGLFAVITICAMINKSLYTHLNNLIPWLKGTLKPALLRSGGNKEAHDLTKERLPLLEDWVDAALWYSLITFVLQILLLLVGGFVVYTNKFSYILLTVIVCLLGSMVMFFPRTVMRRLMVIKAKSFYDVTYTSLMKEQEQEKETNDGNSNGTSSPS